MHARNNIQRMQLRHKDSAGTKIKKKKVKDRLMHAGYSETTNATQNSKRQ